MKPSHRPNAQSTPADRATVPAPESPALARGSAQPIGVQASSRRLPAAAARVGRRISLRRVPAAAWIGVRASLRRMFAAPTRIGGRFSRRAHVSKASTLLAIVALVVLAAASNALAFAPDHRWRTLETPHFVLHFHEGLYPLASRSALSLERAHERLVALLGAEPNRKTQVVLSDDTDSANGSATAYERPRIWLLAAPPDSRSELGDHDDWVFQLVAHEYVHVLQLGAASFPYSWLNWIFGDIFLPNGLHPRFFTEGIATYHESLLGDGGRIRSALFDMYLREDVLGDRILGLSQLSGGTLRWPRGSAAYLYGGRMLAWLAATRGDEKLRAYVHGYGGDVPPYLMNGSLRQAAGVGFEDLWDEWVGSLRER
ncbi:MAG TPA: hypothetical protein VGD74_07420, partial [Vulgatibacter sp.]